MVESAFNPNALSASRASGIWQFMPSTGKHYGLKQNFWFDSRRDVVAATDERAHLPAEAPRRLRRLAARARRLQLGRRQRRPGHREEPEERACRPTTPSLKMPDETRNYLPKLQAVKNIVRDPEKYGLDARRHPGRAVLRRGQDDAQDGREDRGRAGRDAARRVPVPQSAAQPAGHRRRGRVHDPAADRQGGAVRRQARARRPAAGVVAGLPDAQRRDAAAGRRADSGCRSRRCGRSTASARRRRCRPGTRCSCPSQGPSPRRPRRRCRRRCSRRFRRAARSTIG